MSYLQKMAWRNLGRSRGRTMLCVAAVVVGVFIILLVKGFVDGYMGDMINNNISLNSGHVRVIRPEYELKERMLSLGYPIGEEGRGYAQLIKGIRGLPGVTQAVGRIRFGLMLVAGGKQETMLGIGTEPAVEAKAAHLDRFMRDKGAGRLPRPGSQEILLGVQALNKLHLHVGDKVNAIFSTSFGSFKIATFRIVGRLKSGLSLIDGSLAYVPLDTATNLLELDDAVTEILVFGKNPAQAGTLAAALQGFLKGEKLSALKVIPWDKYNELFGFITKANVMYSFIYALIAVMASFIVFNTLMMVVTERTREIGMLTALGLTPKETSRLFIWEGTFVAVLGSAIGALLGGFANWLLSFTGLDLAKLAVMAGEKLLMSPKIYTAFKLGDLLFTFLLGTVITILASYLPARRAARLKPTMALRTI